MSTEDTAAIRARLDAVAYRDLNDLADAIRAVLDLHPGSGWPTFPAVACAHCSNGVPCPTLAAIATALAGTP